MPRLAVACCIEISPFQFARMNLVSVPLVAFVGLFILSRCR